MRIACWLFTLWQAFWLVIFIPGHTRGAITLPADKVSRAQGQLEKPSCCSVIGKPSPGKEPTKDQRRRCAVCHLAKAYTVPTVFVFELELTGRLDERFVLARPQITVIDFGFPYFPSGPPASHVSLGI